MINSNELIITRFVVVAIFCVETKKRHHIDETSTNLLAPNINHQHQNIKTNKNLFLNIACFQLLDERRRCDENVGDIAEYQFELLVSLRVRCEQFQLVDKQRANDCQRCIVRLFRLYQIVFLKKHKRMNEIYFRFELRKRFRRLIWCDASIRHSHRSYHLRIDEWMNLNWIEFEWKTNGEVNWIRSQNSKSNVWAKQPDDGPEDVDDIVLVADESSGID